MNVAVIGLWHLGCVTAACCARHFHVTALDFDSATVAQLNAGHPPILEPGLEERIAESLAAGRLQFTTDPAVACAKADILWLTCDTPVNDEDESDVGLVLETLRRCLPHLRKGALVLISSQLPVGTCRELETAWPQFPIACSPENLRLGRALDSFEKAERIVVGLRENTPRTNLETLLTPFTRNILFMRTESAEMVKHALNGFLALSITFINEIARLCESLGADAHEVAAALKSDSRIGTKAYLGPGGPFAGGTLARDVVTLVKVAGAAKEPLSVIPAIKPSNDRHRDWPFRRLQSRLGTLGDRLIAVLGLVYTPNTDTLRRSAAIDLCRQLLNAGARVQAYDPAVKTLPADLAAVTLPGSIERALAGADAAVVCTEWAQFRRVRWANLLPTMRGRVIIDANRFLEKELKALPGVEHLSVGRL